MQKPRKPNRGSERKSWAPNHYITDEGTRFPVSALNDTASKTGVARTTLALLKAGAKVPRAYW